MGSGETYSLLSVILAIGIRRRNAGVANCNLDTDEEVLGVLATRLPSCGFRGVDRILLLRGVCC